MLTVVAVGVGTLLASTGPAAAGPRYQADLTHACRVQYSPNNNIDGSIYATRHLWENIYGDHCVRDVWSASFPTGLGYSQEVLGGVDVQGYCNKFYRGSTAGNDGSRWYCFFR
jgi:hypothetical protein